MFLQPPPAPEGRGEMLVPPFKGGRSPWGEIGGGILKLDYEARTKV